LHFKADDFIFISFKNKVILVKMEFKSRKNTPPISKVIMRRDSQPEYTLAGKKVHPICWVHFFCFGALGFQKKRSEN